MFDLKLLSELMGFQPRCVCEVGVNNPELCNVAQFNCPKILIEPLPWCAKRLREAFPDAAVIEGCVGDTNGLQDFEILNQLSHLTSLPSSPSSSLYGHLTDPKAVYQTFCFTMDTIDPGNIDVLAADTEGAEWWCLKHLVSRPRIISIETHLANAEPPYTNPFLDNIKAWMAENGYSKLCETVSDSIYIK